MGKILEYTCGMVIRELALIIIKIIIIIIVF